MNDSTSFKSPLELDESEDGSSQPLVKPPITTTTIIIQPISSLEKKKRKKWPSLSNKKCGNLGFKSESYVYFK
ncbi:unnamed protein product, partial [Rotaria sordida]